MQRIAQRRLLHLAHQRHVITGEEIADCLAFAYGAAQVRNRDLCGDARHLDQRSREGSHEAGSRNRADSSLTSDARRGDCIAVLGDRHEGDDAAVQEIDLFDFIAGQMEKLAPCDRDDLQMRLEQRKIPRWQRGQETIAVMLVLICHFGPTPPCAAIPAGWFAAGTSL